MLQLHLSENLNFGFPPGRITSLQKPVGNGLARSLQKDHPLHYELSEGLYTDLFVDIDAPA
ncbi:Uncharacterised protein [Burkholderia pseudomallei]|nr:Uncharacterised protein [Burkholderia pseudomallei]CAJ4480959.1 Uncharacterised protein [Burkholderia pseudomallei]CAJ4657769.1 Uncharacterised protein [Burkholderia pseudomallei]CAJ4668804.1 Uncharacterised protein [Burkholderia pseudomallei]CAJ5802693.1 Uncharacterised protein [Burkholderia pseudomallei]